MHDLFQRIDQAAAAVRVVWPEVPRVAIVLGSGLGGAASAMQVEAVLPYDTLPHFPRCTVAGHAGRLVCGTWCGVPLIVQHGRLHYYEGHALHDVVFPVRVLRALGCQVLLLTNAAGGLNPQYEVGDIVALHDYINLMGSSPLVGPHDERLGPRHPDMSRPFCERLIAAAQAAARRAGWGLPRGVYVAVPGPNYETRAECRWLRRIGGDLVGMSTVPETIAAVQQGMRVAALSVVTNRCLPDRPQTASHADVQAQCAAAAHRVHHLLQALLQAADV
jgi:purine-nucleoside phosphorylase